MALAAGRSGAGDMQEGPMLSRDLWSMRKEKILRKSQHSQAHGCMHIQPHTCMTHTCACGVHASMHTCTPAHMCTPMHTPVHKPLTHLRLYTQCTQPMHTHGCTHTCAHTHICTYTHTHICAHMHTHIGAYPCTLLYSHLYTQIARTDAHMCTQS